MRTPLSTQLPPAFRPRGREDLPQPRHEPRHDNTQRSALDILDRRARSALLVFVAVEVGMLALVLVSARHKWFALDEWQLLAGRNAGSLQSLLRPAIGHWMTLPVLVFRGLFALFGLRTYVPYAAVIVALHLTAAALLRVVMRRAGVGPWIATTAASLFVLFGAGYENITWAVQIDFVGSLVFGLTQLLLSGHDGPIDRRDGLGLLAGTAGLMCSGVAVTMTIAVGLATLARRGWRVAILHTAPLGALYFTWWFGFARHYYHGLGVGIPDTGALFRWVATGVVAAFQAMGQLAGVGIVLAALLAVGLVLAWKGLDRRQLSVRAAPAAALLVCALLFLVMAGSQRQVFHQFNLSSARFPRYLHIFVAMVLPAIAIAADAIVRRWRSLAPVVVVPLVIGIPGNIDAFAHPTTALQTTRSENGYRRSLLSLVSVPVAHSVPRSLPTDSMRDIFAPWPPPADVTIGWLLDQQAAGRLPDLGTLDQTEKADATLELALHQSNVRLGPGSGSAARPPPAPPQHPIPSSASNVPAPLVTTENNAKLGPILVDGNGMTLYTAVAGTRPLPCGASCGPEWSPLVVPPGRAATGGPGVSGLGQTQGRVVTYWGYPLARFSGDRAPGDTNGDNSRVSSGVWRIIRIAPPQTCHALDAPITRRLEKGQTVRIVGGPLGVVYLGPQGTSRLIRFDPRNGNTLVALAGPLTVQLRATRTDRPVTLCT